MAAQSKTPAGVSRGYGRGRIRTCEGISHQIYSLTPLATWVHARASSRKSVPAAGRVDRGGSIRPSDRFSRRRENGFVTPRMRGRFDGRVSALLADVDAWGVGLQVP